MIPALLNEVVTVLRRVSTGTDTLGNPIYGNPVTGSGFIPLYQNMPARLAFSDNKIEFAAGAERVLPYGTMYYSAQYVLQPEDRVVTNDTNIQYVVRSTRIAYLTGTVVDHMECELNLP